MSFVDFLFPLCVLLLIICYYLVPRRHQWIVLLLASVTFYVSWGVSLLVYPLLATLVCWWAARTIQHHNDACDEALAQAADATREEKKALREANKRRCRRILLLVVVLLVGLLVYVKLPAELIVPWSATGLPIELPGLPIVRFGVASGTVTTAATAGADATAGAAPASSTPSLIFSLAMPLGISYWIMSLVSYVADVYWRRDKAEANPARLALFVLYFPKVLEGPIARHRELAPRLSEGAALDYRALCRGLQRMGWGYVKKLVIADRLAPFVTLAFTGWEHQHGSVLLLAAIAGAVQLYADFSGCMDIALGISEALGIELAENFQRPFWALSVAEFWRRWHITLGAWFRDYVYMPLATSPRLIKISGALKKLAGPRMGRAFISVVSLMTTWLLTGLWHATGPSYLAWGLWWGSLIILSTVFEPQLAQARDALHIDVRTPGWQLFQRLRTFACFVASRLLTIPGDLEITRSVMVRIATAFGPWRLVDGSLFEFGYSWPTLVVLVVALAVLWHVDSCEEAGIDVRDRLAERPIVLRWAVYLLLVFAPLVFGAYGAGYNAASFAYMAY